MAEELQHLLDRIQTEAVEQAEGEAASILSKARDSAGAIVAEAETKAAGLLKKAEKDAEAFTERSIKTLEQAGRDLLITVGQGVENVLGDLVEDAVGEALSPETLAEMLVKMTEAYATGEGTEARVEVLLSAADREKLVEAFKGTYREKLVSGVRLHTDNDVLKGFQVSFKDGKVYHDFTQEAIAEALSAFLRPHLAEIIHRVAGHGASAGAKDAGA